MKKLQFKLFSLAVCSLFMLYVGIADAKPNNIAMGRCHMGSCFWWKIENTQEIKSESKGKLIKAFVRSTWVAFPSTILQKKGYPDFPPKKVKWEDPTEEYIFCSDRIPAYFYFDKKQGKYVGSIFGETYGATEAIENLYRYICHKKIKPSSSASEISIDKPIDIFNILKVDENGVIYFSDGTIVDPSDAEENPNQ
jgi:hypothetical protein